MARSNLPLSLYTEWYWQIDLHNLFHFLALRMDPHAQYEIKVYAEAMARCAQAVAPLAYEAFEEHRMGSVTFSRAECEALAAVLKGGEHGLEGRAAATFEDKLGKLKVVKAAEQPEELAAPALNDSVRRTLPGRSGPRGGGPCERLRWQTMDNSNLDEELDARLDVETDGFDVRRARHPGVDLRGRLGPTTPRSAPLAPARPGVVQDDGNAHVAGAKIVWDERASEQARRVRAAAARNQEGHG